MTTLLEDQKMLQHEIYDEMKNSYIDYAMSVIVGRALPDVRDGLKPVHRRILFGMDELGVTPDKPHKKSARIVGEVMGKYHPHGDSSIYDAMVRLAQPFNIRYRLVDGHGNFGSVDGYQAAAMRYTEARMTPFALEMLREIDKDTVDFIPNFDGEEKEPTVLPCRFPNLLVNGSNGIAVGMATSIPPHNLGEVIDAAVKMIEDKECTNEDLIKIVKGPDFPTGGIIMGKNNAKQAYRTGQGKVIIRSKAEIEESNRGKHQIIVTEIPYQVNKARMIEKIADLVKEKKLEGISDISDQSNREGIRIVIELKRDVNPQIMLNKLYKHTQLQESFSMIMLAIVNGEPKLLTLYQMLDEYLKHQKDVVTRRTQFDLNKAEARAHILEGLRIALDNIDEIIATIRSSYNDAKEKLMEKFALTDIQAQAILDMRLARLQGLEREKIEAEYAELMKKIAYYKQLLSDEDMLMGVIRDELLEIKEKYNDKRRTKIVADAAEMDEEDLIEEEQVAVTLTHLGYIKRIPADTYKTQKRGGKGITGLTTRENDFVKDLIMTSTLDYLMFFKDSVRGLQPGAPVEFRGIRLGTVSKVPFFAPNMRQTFNDDYRIPVLIRIEPERLKMQLGENADVVEHLGELLKRGLRGSLKTGNLVTGALYVDLDFYPNTPAITGIREFNGYQIIPTVSGGLAQIQQRLMEALDKINKLPLNPMIEQATSTLSESQRTMKNLQTTLDSMNKILASQSMQQLPTDMQSTLRELNRSMQGFQPGSAAYNKMVADMQRLDQVLRELQPVLKTLNEKSNALVFEAKDKKDPEPKRAKQ